MRKMDEMKKYIIEFSEDPHTIRLIKVKNGDKFPITEFKTVKSYIEPDMEQVRKEAYQQGYTDGCKKHEVEIHAIAYAKGIEDGYQKGLNDAWNAANKILELNTNARTEIFSCASFRNTIAMFSASEAIERLQAYEQEKEEEIKVGNEVKGGDEKYIVLQKFLNNIDKQLMVVLFNRRDGQIGTWHMYNANGAIFEKTGRHFPEIAEVLKKMKEVRE